MFKINNNLISHNSNALNCWPSHSPTVMNFIKIKIKKSTLHSQSEHTNKIWLIAVNYWHFLYQTLVPVINKSAIHSIIYTLHSTSYKINHISWQSSFENFFFFYDIIDDDGIQKLIHYWLFAVAPSLRHRHRRSFLVKWTWTFNKINKISNTKK